MRKITIIFLALATLFVGQTFAQNNQGKADDAARIAISPQVNDQEIPSGAKKLLVNKMKQICAKNGMSGDGQNPFFIMEATVDILSKELTPTAPPMHALNMSINFYIKNAKGEVFSETSIEAKGVGANETKAYIAGIKNVNTSSGQYKAMIDRGKTKILEFYNSQCDMVISKAKALHKQGKNGEAIKVLESVPSVSKECYDMCMELLAEIEPPVDEPAGQSSGGGSSSTVSPGSLQGSGGEIEIDDNLFLVYKGAKMLDPIVKLHFALENRGGDDYEFKDYVFDTRIVDDAGKEFKLHTCVVAGNGENSGGTYRSATIINGTPVPAEFWFENLKSVAMFEFPYKGQKYRIKDITLQSTAAQAPAEAASSSAPAPSSAPAAAPSSIGVNSKVYLEKDRETRFKYKQYAPGKVKTLASAATKNEYEVMAISDCSSDVVWTADVITQWHDATKDNLKEGMTVLYTYYGNDKSNTVCYNIGKVVAVDEMYKNIVTIKGYSDDIVKVDFNKVLIVDKNNLDQ